MRRTAAVLLLPLVGLVACAGDDGKELVANAEGGGGGGGVTTVAGQAAPETVGPSGGTRSYVVREGDTLWDIAERHCVDVGDIPTVNGWDDGIDHTIKPDDLIALPAEGCTPDDDGSAGSGGGGTDDDGDDSPTTDTPTTEVATAAEVDSWLRARDGFAPDPMLGDPSDYHEDFGPKCVAAWETAYSYERVGLGASDLLRALDPLPGDVPGSVRTSIQRWSEFTDEWYLRYEDLIDEYSSADGTDYDRLVRDADYRTFLAHYLPVADHQLAPKDWVVATCVALLERNGSTP